MPRLAALIAALLLTACATPPPAAPTVAPAPAAPAAAATATPAAIAPAAVAPEAAPRRLPPAVTVPSIDLDNAADGTRVTVKRGTELKILLDAIATTGFQWQATPPNGAPVLALIGERVYVPKSVDVQNLGGGGINIYRFRGEQPGKVTLQFEYRRPWETVAAAKTVRYEVTVE